MIFTLSPEDAGPGPGGVRGIEAYGVSPRTGTSGKLLKVVFGVISFGINVSGISISRTP